MLITKACHDSRLNHDLRQSILLFSSPEMLASPAGTNVLLLFFPQQGGTFGPITHRDKDRKTLGTQHQVVCVCVFMFVCVRVGLIKGTWRNRSNG